MYVTYSVYKEVYNRMIVLIYKKYVYENLRKPPISLRYIVNFQSEQELNILPFSQKREPCVKSTLVSSEQITWSPWDIGPHLCNERARLAKN